MEPTIVFFGVAEWTAMAQRSHHLARSLAASHRVIYVNPCYYSAFGFGRDALLRKRRRRRVYGIEQVTPSLHVVSLPPLLPKGLEVPGLGRLNYRLLLPLLRRSLRGLGVSRPILWVSLPPDRALAGQLDERLVVYDCMDRHAAFRRGGAARRLAREEEILLSECDVVLASSRGLEAHCSEFNDHVYLVRNGVDATWFQTQARRPLAPLRSGDANQRVLGYVGTVGPWVDVELLVEVARTHPEQALVLIGPVQADISNLVRQGNVQVLGERSYDDVPSLVTQVDVCLVPFRLNAVTQDVNPIKLYESFSLGKPVVTTALPEVEAYREVAYVAQSKSDFLTSVDRALGEDDDGLRRRRRQIAAENTWALRAQQILGILSSHLHEK